MQTLEAFIAQLVAQITPDHGLTPEQALRLVTYQLEEWREEYRENGAPLGDTDEGFVAWLQLHHQPPTA